MGKRDDDEELAELLDAYLEPPRDDNLRMAGVVLVWVEDEPRLGVQHMLERHGVTKQEVAEVLLEVPPYVESRRHPDHPNRTLFWGATRQDRWLFVVTEDWTEKGQRYLKPITAFEPDEDEMYWRNR